MYRGARSTKHKRLLSSLFYGNSLLHRIAVCMKTVLSVGADIFYQKYNRIKPSEVHNTPSASLRAQAR